MKKIYVKIFLIVFILFFTILNIINNIAVTINDNGVKSTYLYSLSLEQKNNLSCNSNISSVHHKVEIEGIETYSTFGLRSFAYNKLQKTRCQDLIVANSFLGIVKVQHINSIALDNRSSDFILIIFVPAFLGMFFVVLLYILFKFFEFNKFIYEKKHSKFDKFILLQMIFIFGSYSLILGQDVNWDLMNYHYYNGWAFLHDRINVDITPNNGLHGYFSPILDVAQYLFIYYLPTPLFSFLFGAVSGVSGFYCYKLNKLIFINVKDDLFRHQLIIFSTIIGITSVSNVMQIGTVTSENIISCLLIIGIYLLLARMDNYSNFLLSFIGLLLGVTLGFKLTAFTVIVPICLVFFLQNMRNIWGISILFISIIIGFVIVDGVWMYKMYQLFGNPIYPSFGKYINPQTALDFQRDTTFLPKDMLHWLFLPYYMFIPNKLTGEISILDMRFGFAFIAIVSIFIFSFKKAINKKLQFQILVFILGYICWLCLFSIYRYTIVLGYLSGAIIFFPFVLYNGKFKKAMTALFVLILLSTSTNNMGHSSYKNKIYDSNLVIHRALVIFNENPTSYIIPTLGASNIYINAPDFPFTSKFDHDRKVEILNESIQTKKDIYLVLKDLNQYEWINQYNLILNQNNCQLFNESSDIYLCKLNYRKIN